MSFAIFETVEIRLGYHFKIESALMRTRRNFRNKGKSDQKFLNPELCQLVQKYNAGMELYIDRNG